ncbi:hypothetical protein HAX54_038053 [Datura stramonium]|uniref:Uncharacterized protein n=1 Tax=Datura stramonium TaxID=4076 RepID=A0ABS8VMN8_DATST|nr:hypothetical protein [Datura stramonium]
MGKENVTALWAKSLKVLISRIGNEPFLRDYKDTLTNVTGPALENIQMLRMAIGLGDTTKAASKCVFTYHQVDPPSLTAGFSRDIVELSSNTFLRIIVEVRGIPHFAMGDPRLA